jgi:hypothetical protein
MMHKLFARLLIAASLCFFAGPTFAAGGWGSTFGTGSTDVVTTASLAGVSSTVSFSAWIWINGAGAGNFGNVETQQTNGSAANLTLQMAGNTTTMQLFGGFSSTNGSWQWTPGATGAWQHLCLTYNSSSTSNKPTVYVNGSPVTVTTHTNPVGSFISSSHVAYIGNNSTNVSTWDGKIAEFTEWNGLILTGPQCAALAAGEPILKVVSTAPTFYLPLYNFGGSVMINDWGANHLTQTLTGVKAVNHPPIQQFPLGPPQ